MTSPGFKDRAFDGGGYLNRGVQMKNQQKRKSGKVHFSKTCNVILVPSKEEYVEAGISLWHDRQAQEAACQEVGSEVKHLKEWIPSLSVVTAMNYLYQPEVQSNFRIKNMISHLPPSSIKLLFVDTNVDRAVVSRNKVSRALAVVPQWTLCCNLLTSTEALMKHVTLSVNSSENCFDVVLLDESVVRLPVEQIPAFDYSRCGYNPLKNDRRSVERFSEEAYLEKIVLLLRTAYGSNVLLGLQLLASCSSFAASTSGVGDAGGNLGSSRSYGGSSGNSSEARQSRLLATARRMGVDFMWTEKNIDDLAPVLTLLLSIRTVGRRGVASTASDANDRSCSAWSTGSVGSVDTALTAAAAAATGATGAARAGAGTCGGDDGDMNVFAIATSH